MLDYGLISNKYRGSFTKFPGQRGIYGSDPLDHDPGAQDKRVRGSNRVRWFWIGRLGCVDARGRRRRPPEFGFRGGARLGLAGVHRKWCSGGRIDWGFGRG